SSTARARPARPTRWWNRRRSFPAAQSSVAEALPDSAKSVWRHWLALERLARQPACTLLPFQMEVR
ncbi:MAG TPA: hypothetical protein VL132_10040, partial [Planctomycetaceae bacterium]|nr:hypothetical protein [Planctomycetaceae bacterium]